MFGGIINQALGWLFGSGTKVIDEAFYTDQEKAQDILKDGVYNLTIDAVSRFVRPGLTIFVAGGMMGFWDLPNMDEVSEYWQGIFYLIITFWFGGRVVMKDLPKLIRAFKNG